MPVCSVTSREPIMRSTASVRSRDELTSFTPPALPRAPAWICAFTTQRFPPTSSATRAAAREEYTTSPGGTGTP